MIIGVGVGGGGGGGDGKDERQMRVKWTGSGGSYIQTRARHPRDYSRPRLSTNGKYSTATVRPYITKAEVAVTFLTSITYIHLITTNLHYH